MRLSLSGKISFAMIDGVRQSKTLPAQYRIEFPLAWYGKASKARYSMHSMCSVHSMYRFTVRTVCTVRSVCTVCTDRTVECVQIVRYVRTQVRRYACT